MRSPAIILVRFLITYCDHYSLIASTVEAITKGVTEVAKYDAGKYDDVWQGHI